MQKLGKFLGSCSGSAIITALVMGVVFSILAIAFIRLTTRSVQMSRRDIEAVKCFWANEGFLRLTLRALTLDKGQNGMPERMDADRLVLDGLPSGISLNHYNMHQDAEVSIEWAGYPLGGETCPDQVGIYNIVCSMPLRTGNRSVKYVTRIDSVVVKSIQRYTFFEDTTADPNVWWREFVVNGDYHCNGITKLDSTMTPGVHVRGKATTSGAVPSPDNTQTDQYVEPYNMGVHVAGHTNGSNEDWLKERLPEYAHVGKIQTDMVDPETFSSYSYLDKNGVRVDDPVGIEFAASGEAYVYRKTASGWQALDTLEGPDVVIRTWNTATVWGTVQGRFTVVTRTGQDLVIGGEIRCVGGTGTGQPNGIALVSGNDVVVPGNFNCTVGSSNVIQDYSFADSSKTVVQACIFCKRGGLYIDIPGLNPGSYAGLDSLLVEGSVMVHHDYDKIWELAGNNFAGLKCIYSRDERYYYNEIRLPGIQFPLALDEEREGDMWVLATGKWKSTLVVAQ